MRNILVFVVSISILLGGCAASGVPFSEQMTSMKDLSPSHGRIIVFRTKDSIQYSGRAASIKLDNKDVGSCDYGGYLLLNAESGKHVVTTDLWDSPGTCNLPVEIQANQLTFLEVTPRVGNLVGLLSAGIIGAAIESHGNECGGAFAIQPVDRDIALQKLSNLKMSE